MTSSSVFYDNKWANACLKLGKFSSFKSFHGMDWKSKEMQQMNIDWSFSWRDIYVGQDDDNDDEDVR